MKICRLNYITNEISLLALTKGKNIIIDLPSTALRIA